MPAPAPMTIFGVTFPSIAALAAALGLRSRYSAAKLARQHGTLEALAMRRLGTDDPAQAAAALRQLRQKQAHAAPPLPSGLALLTRLALRGILTNADHAAALRNAAATLGVEPPPSDLALATAAMRAFSQSLDLASMDAVLGSIAPETTPQKS